MKRRVIQFGPFLMIGAVENGPLRAEAIFARKKIILQYFEKHTLKVVLITFRLRQIHGQMKCIEPLLQRLPLKYDIRLNDQTLHCRAEKPLT